MEVWKKWESDSAILFLMTEDDWKWVHLKVKEGVEQIDKERQKWKEYLCMLIIIPEGDRVDNEWKTIEAPLRACGSLEVRETQDLPPSSVRSTAPE